MDTCEGHVCIGATLAGIMTKLSLQVAGCWKADREAAALSLHTQVP